MVPLLPFLLLAVGDVGFHGSMARNRGCFDWHLMRRSACSAGACPLRAAVQAALPARGALDVLKTDDDDSQPKTQAKKMNGRRKPHVLLIIADGAGDIRHDCLLRMRSPAAANYERAVCCRLRLERRRLPH